MNYFTFSAAPVVALLLTSTALAAPVQGMQSPAYQSCIALSKTNPVTALAKADEWLAIDSGVAAQHCRAMALYGARRFEEAAESLGVAREMIAADNLSMRSFITGQQVTAWKQANRSDLALQAVDAQLAEITPARGNNIQHAKLASNLLLERARLMVPFGKTSDALRDLDHAVSLTPLNTDVLLERAQTFEIMGDASLAKADIETVLSINPNHTRARSMLAKLETKNAK